jgi:tuftelin-interacting protein 11
MSAFNMNDEYEGGVKWIGNEAYAGKSKAKRVQTKEQALYGEDYEDDLDEGLGSRGMRAVLSKPMSFVSSGIFMPSADEKKEEKAEEESSEKTKRAKTEGDSKDEKMKEEDESAVPERFLKRKKEKEEEAKSKTEKKKVKLPAAKAVMDKDFAAFGKFSDNYGLKILLKNGFTGRLGKSENGMVNPIQATVRPGRAGLGAIKEKQQSKELEAKFAQERGEAPKKEEEEKPKERWKKQTQAKTKKQYRTKQDLEQGLKNSYARIRTYAPAFYLFYIFL